MDVTYAAKVRHMRSDEDYAAIITQAQVRRERRVRRGAGLRLAVQAGRLIRALEDRRASAEEAASERWWTDLLTGYNA